MANKGLFKNIDYQNKVTPTPLERNDVHVDRSHDFYTNIIDAAESGELDINKINAFTGISRSRDQVYDLLDIYEKEISINTKNKRKIYNFEINKIENIYDIKNIIESNNYKIYRYNIFSINSPKYRIVMSLNIKDKIINHYVSRFILIPKLDKYLDIRNCATRKNIMY